MHGLFDPSGKTLWLSLSITVAWYQLMTWFSWVAWSVRADFFCVHPGSVSKDRTSELNSACRHAVICCLSRCMCVTLQRVNENTQTWICAVKITDLAKCYVVLTLVLAFCRAMLCMSEAYAAMRCPSVCLSVTLVYSVETNKHVFINFSPSGNYTIAVFRCWTLWEYYDEPPPLYLG